MILQCLIAHKNILKTIHICMSGEGDTTCYSFHNRVCTYSTECLEGGHLRAHLYALLCGTEASHDACK